MTKIFISGMPGCGKTSLLLQIIDELKKRGRKVGGILSPEIRNKIRKGFWIVDIASGKKAKMAEKSQAKGCKVAGYVINKEAIDEIVKQMRKSVDGCDVIVIDEIGKMELCSETFKQAISELIKSQKPLIASLHRAYFNEYKSKYDGIFLWLTRENFEKIKEHILKFIT